MQKNSVKDTRIVPHKPAMTLNYENKNYLIITDIHLGFESILFGKEINIGSNTYGVESIQSIEELIKSTNSDSVIILGDIKSSINRISDLEWKEMSKLMKKLNDITHLIIIPGNHDSNIQKISTQSSVTSNIGITLGNILLTHGHILPTRKMSYVSRIIMGHVHPIFFSNDSILNGQRVWVNLQCDRRIIFPSTSGKLDVTVVPSFNQYIVPVYRHRKKSAISPIISRILKKEFVAKIITLDGTIIGNEDIIHNVL